MRVPPRHLILLFILLVATAALPAFGTRGRGACWFHTYVHTLQGPHAKVASQILDHWEAFQTEARRAALATFGLDLPPLARVALRERIFTWLPSPDESHAYALFFRSAVQSEIDAMHLGPHNGARSGLYDQLLLQGFASHGVVLVLHPAEGQQARAAKLLDSHPEMRFLPRVATADEEMPLGAALSRQLSAVWYWPYPFTAQLLDRIEPRFPVFDIHVMGGALNAELARELGLFTRRIAQDREVQRVRVRVHAAVSYVVEPGTILGERNLSLEVALTRDWAALEPWARWVAKYFGAEREVRGEIPERVPNAYYFDRPDLKIVSVHIEPRI